jgi:hypothetical protein
VSAAFEPMFLVIARAAGPAADSPYAQVRYNLEEEPDAATLAEMQTGVERTYLKAFGEAPARVGVGLVPWVADQDGPADEEEGMGVSKAGGSL